MRISSLQDRRRSPVRRRFVGVFKAYQEMTGETINADIIDASLNELVVTGQLEQSIAGLSDEEVEEFIASSSRSLHRMI